MSERELRIRDAIRKELFQFLGQQNGSWIVDVDGEDVELEFENISNGEIFVLDENGEKKEFEFRIQVV